MRARHPRLVLALSLTLGWLAPLSLPLTDPGRHAIAVAGAQVPGLPSTDEAKPGSATTASPSAPPAPKSAATPTPAPQGRAPTSTPKKGDDEKSPRVRVIYVTATPQPTAPPTATATPTPTVGPKYDSNQIRLPGGQSASDYVASQTSREADGGAAVQPAPATEGELDASEVEPEPTPTLVIARVVPSLSLSGLWKVMRYRDFIEAAATSSRVDPIILAALLDVEGAGESAVSPAGAMGLMQLRQDKFRPGDDPFDPRTNILRAAEHLRSIQNRWNSPEQIAAAYFGAIDSEGQVTNASDGTRGGREYVEQFLAAHARYKNVLGTDLPSWLASPLGDVPLTSDMISFGYYGEYGTELALHIRGASGLATFGTQHLGLDLRIPGRPDGGRGAPVVAPFDGRIIRTSDPVGGPFGIWLESEKLDLRARIMHMDGLVAGIETGVRVSAGEQLGVLGGQGTEESPHLHLSFERMSDGTRINPALFYRLRDGTDRATIEGTWANDAPRFLRTSVNSDIDGLLHSAEWRRQFTTRWGPFEIQAP